MSQKRFKVCGPKRPPPLPESQRLSVTVEPGTDLPRSRKASARLAKLLRRVRAKREEAPDELVS